MRWKNFTFIFLFFSCVSHGADLGDRLADVAAVIGSGDQRDWTKPEIGENLRLIVRESNGSVHSTTASAMLAFHLSQVPGDHSDEILRLYDNVAIDAPSSWQLWMASFAKIAVWGLREGQNKMTLEAALEADSRINEEKIVESLSSEQDVKVLEILMDRWPPQPGDFTDVIHKTISEQYLILGDDVHSKKFAEKIIDPNVRLRALQWIDQSREWNPKPKPAPPNEAVSNRGQKLPTVSSNIHVERSDSLVDKRRVFLLWIVIIALVSIVIVLWKRLKR